MSDFSTVRPVCHASQLLFWARMFQVGVDERFTPLSTKLDSFIPAWIFVIHNMNWAENEGLRSHRLQLFECCELLYHWLKSSVNNTIHYYIEIRLKWYCLILLPLKLFDPWAFCIWRTVVVAATIFVLHCHFNTAWLTRCDRDCILRRISTTGSE